MNNPDHPANPKNYWETRWLNNTLGWDIGYAAPAITEYMAQYTNKDAAILIPGCGNAYEAAYLVEHGFTDITLIDIAPKAIELAKENFKNNPQVKLICGDFFEHHEPYDLIIEQTFFCAIAVELRTAYAQKMSEILKEGGKLIGLLFNKEFASEGPPFGGSEEEYSKIFEPFFQIKTLENCRNSIPPRQKTELFINFVKNKDK